MRSTDRAATLASVVVLTGVQGIAPALPEIRDVFGLNDSGASLLTLGYLLAAFGAGPLAALADRLGERLVLVASLVVFGLAGGVVTVAPDFTVLIAARTVQGAAFGVVMAITIGLMGKGLDLVPLARAHGVRVIAMAMAEVVLPLAVGALLEVASWRAAAALQMAALPVAIYCAWVLPHPGPDEPRVAERERGMRPALSALATPFGVAVQVPGFARFLLKFAMLTYWPLLAADAYGMSAWSIGLALSASAVASILAAWAAPSLIGRYNTAQASLVGLLLAAVPFVLLPVATSSTHFVLLILITGAGEGVLGVANNVSASEAAPEVGRSAFFGLTGTIRNLGRFSGLAILGGLTLMAPLAGALALVGVLGIVSAAAVPVMARGLPPPE
ncbi:MFS transporter [soil metagenome]